MKLEDYADKTGMTTLQMEEVLAFIINQVDDAKSQGANPYSYMQACLGSLILTGINCDMRSGDIEAFIRKHTEDLHSFIQDTMQSPILGADGANMMRG